VLAIVSFLSSGFGESQKRAGMSSDHQLFVGWNYPNRDLAAGTGNPWTTLGIPGFINFNSQPR
jgi:hypothetical protein